MSAASLRYLHAVLHSALSQAVEWRIIATNPADRIRLPAKTGEVMTGAEPHLRFERAIAPYLRSTIRTPVHARTNRELDPCRPSSADRQIHKGAYKGASEPSSESI